MSKGKLMNNDDELFYGDKYYIGDKLHYCDEEDLDFSGETVATLRHDLEIPDDIEIREFDCTTIYNRKDISIELD